MKAVLKRLHYLNDCIIGVLLVGGKEFYTLELPWKDNASNVSCIPEGDYKFLPHGWESNSKRRFQKVWHIQDVKSRSYILIHTGNYSRNTQGCILVGKGVNIVNGCGSLTGSKEALNELREIIGRNSGEIKIERLNYA